MSRLFSPFFYPHRPHLNALLLILVMLLLGCGSQPKPQSPQSSPQEDEAMRYQPTADASFTNDYAATYRFRNGRPVGFRFTPDMQSLLFLRSGGRDFVRNLYKLDLKTMEESLVLTADSLLAGETEELSAEELARRERLRLTARGIPSFDLTPDGKQLLIPLSGELYLYELESGAVRALPSEAGYPLMPEFSPDGSKLACVRNGDLFVTDLATGVETQLTHRESEAISYGVAEFAAQEEMGRYKGYWWSPDSQSIALQQTDTSGMETFHIVDPLDPGQPGQSWAYPRAGGVNAKVRLGLLQLSGGPIEWIEWDHEAYPYLASVVWSENAPLTFLVQNRKQQEEVLYAYREGKADLLLRERDTTWINLDQSMPYWLAEGDFFLWTTERNGSWQLEKRDATGQLVQILTPLDLNLRSFLFVNEEAGSVYVTGGPNPTQAEIFSLPLTPRVEPTTLNELKQLTSEPGLHDLSFASDGSLAVLHATHLDQGHTWTLLQTSDFSPLAEITSMAAQPAFATQVELTEVEANGHSYHAAILRPEGAQEEQRFPVILYVYGGPSYQTVQADQSRYYLQQWMANHGFIVVAIDNRGTPARGRDWERAIYGNLIELALEDQSQALQALGKSYPEMDLDQVGIYGWSFGGYLSSMAIARQPELFKAAVAGAPVCDWADYDTHYTERYLGLPKENAQGYEASNVLSYAPQLERPFLLIHGTADDNVYLVHALKMIDAFLRAGRDHELLLLPGHTHIVRDPEIVSEVYRRLMAFFVAELQSP